MSAMGFMIHGSSPRVREMDRGVVAVTTSDLPESFVAEIERSSRLRGLIAILLKEGKTGDGKAVVDWLNEFAEKWSKSAVSAQSPWGALHPLPLIIVDLGEEKQNATRDALIGWGISSFADGRNLQKVADDLEKIAANATKDGAFEAPPSAPSGESQPSHEGLADEASYAGVLAALHSFGRDRRQDEIGPDEGEP